VGIACYLINQTPSLALDEKNPDKVCCSKKPSLTHLRLFGCDAYVHIPKENISKLYNKVEKYTFIGYKDCLKGYNIWNPETKKVVYIQYVVFREIKALVKQEVLPREEEPDKIYFGLKDNESKSTE